MRPSRDANDSTVFSQSDLLQLLEDYQGPYVSLFMPTHAAPPERRQDEIRLRNLVREADRQLRTLGNDAGQTQRLLSRLAGLPADAQCWARRSHGLAAFATSDFFRCFNLPLDFQECVIVDDHFHISPLVPMLHANGRYFILALTKDSADLYEATRYSIVEHELPALSPPQIDGQELPLQYHSHRAPAGGKGGTAEAIFHGQGGIADRERDDVRNFFKRQVEPCVSFVLRDQQAPLVIACTTSLLSLYLEANTYPHVCRKHVAGSPVEMTESELHRKSWDIVAPSFREVEQQARRKYESLAGSERTQTVTDPILTAARRGRIDTLFLPMAGPNFRSMSDAADKIEEAAEQTLLFGGQVLAVDDVPGDASLAAVLRY